MYIHMLLLIQIASCLRNNYISILSLNKNDDKGNKNMKNMEWEKEVKEEKERSYSSQRSGVYANIRFLLQIKKTEIERIKYLAQGQ